MQPQGTKLCNHIRAECKNRELGFLNAWDTSAGQNGWSVEDSKAPVDDWSFLEGLFNYLTDVKEPEQLAEQLESFMTDAKEIIQHWKRRNHIYAILQQSLSCAEDRTIWCWMDWKELLNYIAFLCP